MSSPVRLASFSFSSFLSLAYLLTTLVNAAREALFVSAALVGVDRVGEGVHRLGVAGVPLHCDLDLMAPRPLPAKSTMLWWIGRTWSG